jgi:acetolactate synthase-1/2/3 large subunit
VLSINELATVAQEELAVAVLVFVDGSYGVIRNIQQHQYGGEVGRIGVELGRPDFCAIAAGFGIQAARVSSLEAYAKAVQRALGGHRGFLIEVDLDAIGPMKIPYTGTSRPPRTA